MAWALSAMSAVVMPVLAMPVAGTSATSKARPDD
jgi:hypothetical protein